MRTTEMYMQSLFYYPDYLVFSHQLCVWSYQRCNKTWMALTLSAQCFIIVPFSNWPRKNDKSLGLLLSMTNADVTVLMHLVVWLAQIHLKNGFTIQLRGWGGVWIPFPKFVICQQNTLSCKWRKCGKSWLNENSWFQIQLWQREGVTKSTGITPLFWQEELMHIINKIINNLFEISIW